MARFFHPLILSGDDFPDGLPHVDGAMKEMFGVSDDYFTAILADPRPEEVPRLREELISLCRAACHPAIASSSDHRGPDAAIAAPIRALRSPRGDA